MSLFGEDGGRIVVAAKSRLRDSECIEERDRKVCEALCEGKSLETTAAIYRITPRYVRIIIKRIPPDIRQEIRRDVQRRRQERLQELAEVCR
jgi:hypothetical protein